MPAWPVITWFTCSVELQTLSRWWAELHSVPWLTTPTSPPYPHSSPYLPPHYTEPRRGWKWKIKRKPCELGPLGPLKQLTKIIFVLSLCLLWVPAHSFCVWLFMCICKVCANFLHFFTKTWLKSNKSGQGVIKGSSWRFHVPFIPI